MAQAQRGFNNNGELSLKSQRVRQNSTSPYESESVGSSEENGNYRIKKGWEFVKVQSKEQQARSNPSSLNSSVSQILQDQALQNNNIEEQKTNINNVQQKQERNGHQPDPVPQNDEQMSKIFSSFRLEEIYNRFVPQIVAQTQNYSVLDPENYTTKNLVSKSASFGTWVCMLPVLATWWCIQGFFNCQVAIVSALLRAVLPDLPSVDDTKEMMQPAVSVLKKTALRLAIIVSVISGALIFSTTVYAIFYYLVIPVNHQEAPLHFQLQKLADIQNQSSTVGAAGTETVAFAPKPALHFHLPIESALTEYQKQAMQKATPVENPQEEESDSEHQFSSLNGPYIYEKGSLKQEMVQIVEKKESSHNEHSGIRMDSEYYQLEVVFEVAMTMHNFERGNLYLQSDFNSYKQGMKSLSLARSGFLNPQGTITLQLRELISMIPFSSYFFSCGYTEQVTIQIFDSFDNDDFGLKSIDFLVPNEALQFKSAHIRVNTALYGPRWLMSRWFFTTALVFIFSMSFTLSFTTILTLIIVRTYLPIKWL